SGTASGAMTLGTGGLFTGMGGYTPTWSPATINVGASSTLSVAVPAATRSQDVTFKVAGTDPNGAHHFAQATIPVLGAAPTLTMASPATGPTQGGTQVSLTGTNIGPGAVAKICSTTTTTCSTVTTAGNGVTAKGGYVNGSGGTKFNLTMPSHTAA